MKRYDYLCTATATISTVMQPDEILRVISMAITCISVFVSLCFTLYKWYKEATKDNKVTEEEIDKAIDIVQEHIETINDKANKDGKK